LIHYLPYILLNQDNAFQKLQDNKEQFNYTYVSGDPKLQLNIFKKSKRNINELLFNASLDGSLEVVKYLVEQGADIHDNNDLVLIWARGHLEVVKYLVEQGADIHAKNDAALKWASENGYYEVVIYLKEQMNN
jgi:ankyrin repeat protein